MQPNNGPFEASNQIRHLEQKSLRGNGWLTGKNIVIGFNYSTDIFRINDGWDPRRFVPLEKKDLEKIFLIPGYHDLLLLKARIAGKKFGSTVSDASKTIDYYFKISDEQRQENIERWLVDLRNNGAIKDAAKTLVIFPPYWYSAASKIRKNQIRANIFYLLAAQQSPSVFKDIWIGTCHLRKQKWRRTTGTTCQEDCRITSSIVLIKRFFCSLVRKLNVRLRLSLDYPPGEKSGS